ncbi:hypothetical protein ACOMHN_026082 [Nucella lapillus]
MKPDDIYRLIRGDSLILMLGERLFEKRDIEEHTSGQIGGRLRELGRLLQVLRKNSKMTVSNLKAALDPANFDILITCVRELAQFDISSHMYKKGSLALKVGYALRKCSQLLAAQAIKSNDKVILDKVSRFEQLYSANWYDRISACAAQSVGRAQMNKLLLLPTISDVEMVNRLLEKDCKSDSYPTLAKATLALITIFNRKRGGEVQRMKVNDFKLKPKMSRVDSEILQGLTETEKKLAAILQRVEIRGKFNRPVPILLTPVMIESIQKLLQMRTSMKLDSPYLFITPNGSNPYRGSDTIRQYAEAAEIGDDALFTATNLRKQYLEAIRRLKKDGIRLKRTIHVVFGPDEEISSGHGMEQFVQHQGFKDLNVGFALDEGMASPTEEFRLFNGERLAWWFIVTFTGNPGHGSAFIPNTAVSKLNKLINRALRYRDEQEQRLKTSPSLGLGDVTSLNITALTGGVQGNVVPCEMSATFDIRLSADENLEEFEEMIHQWCKDACPHHQYNIEFLQKGKPTQPSPADSSSPWWVAVDSAVQKLGIQVRKEIFPCGTDGYHLRKLGIPVYGFSPMNHTPILLHDHNEFLNQQVFLRGITIYTGLIPALADVTQP